MTYGLRILNAAGGIIMDLTGQSARTIYRQSIGAITTGMSVTVPGFDPARGVVFFIANGNPSGFVPPYRIAGNVIMFEMSGSSNTTYILHAVMFS
ncbi:MULTISPECIES: hypothetical protein [Pseudomonas aeruginosa group]|jgi:hypothetical protein|nr:hypothetical protein [Pseudomonas aeruginosa]DBA08830.1 TPA_asm: hypothetical protein [Pseudomonas phage vB_PaeS-D14P]EIU1420964.1 hypothetical protein [Pseudomonas aeruginosa]EKD1543172.1 hypothetical protein [Pseudomonas aeruginosa]EKL8565150.1 hypothetical protein [Pseudomonas aeruginosa]EKT8051157.1 hypothetical protein [Pseudomonas aeruginosa]